MKLTLLFFGLGLLPLFALAEREKLFEAEKKLALLASQPFSSLKNESTKKEWANARIAWIALERLRGRETSARKIYQGCEKNCEKYGNKSDWQAVKEWAKALKN